MKEESPKKRRSKRGRESDEDCLEEVIEGDDEGEGRTGPLSEESDAHI